MDADARQLPSPPPLILASASPRRRELLAHLGVPFEVKPSNAPEVPAPDETPARFAQRVAADKALDVAQHYPGRVVLGADTIVVKDGVIFGKPIDRSDARRMLSTLSGTAHEVMTGVAVAVPRALTPLPPLPLRGEGDSQCDAASKEPLAAASREAHPGCSVRAVLAISRVEFRALSVAEIEAYLDTDEPWDKAGAYALQGQAGAFVTTVEGSRSNIIGLPLRQVGELLAPFFEILDVPQGLR